MLVCFDSSALVKLLVEEPGSDAAATLWDEADAVVASRLVVPEVSAALAAAARARRLDGAQLEAAHGTWHQYLPALRLIELTHQVAVRAADLAGELVLGGADAVHLASALALDGGQPVLAAWDRRLWAAARSAGLRVAPVAL